MNTNLNYRFYFLLLYIFSLNTDSFAQGSTIHNRVLIAININSCAYCNKATNSIIDKSLTDKIDLVFSSEDATPEQVDEFITNNFDAKPRYVFNDKLYQKISKNVKLFKNPYFIILDTNNAIVTYFPIDSVLYYKDLIDATIKKKKTKTEISNDRIKRTSGYSNINKVNDYLFVTSWANPNKTYYYNLKTKVLDSLYFYNNEKLIYKLLEMKGVKGINVSEVKKIYKEHRLPYELVSFSTRPYNTDKRFYNIMYVQYLDPKLLSDTISPELLFFLFSFDPKAKDLKIHTYKYWEKDWESGEVVDDLRLDGAVLSEINDSLWMMGAEHINEEKSDKKTFLYYANNNADKELKYNGQKFSIRTDSMLTFDNEPMNNPVRLYLYRLLPSFLFYTESPFYYNYKLGKTFNIRNISDDITWIFDAHETDNTLSILLEENSSLVVYNLDKNTNQILSREYLGKNDTKGNAVLDENGNVVYLNKKGSIVWYSL